MNPSRRTHPTRQKQPTRATVAATISATVDSGPRFRSRLVPKTAYAIIAAKAVYKPFTVGTPASLA